VLAPLSKVEAGCDVLSREEDFFGDFVWFPALLGGKAANGAGGNVDALVFYYYYCCAFPYMFRFKNVRILGITLVGRPSRGLSSRVVEVLLGFFSPPANEGEGTMELFGDERGGLSCFRKSNNNCTIF
jgi:hypothetical protein